MRPGIRERTVLAFLLAAAVCGAAPALAVASREGLPGRGAIGAEYRQLLATFDPRHPGRGPDVFNRAPLDLPTAYASILTAEALRWRKRRSRSALRRARRSGRWLLDNRDLNRNGIVGWGLPTRFERVKGEFAPANSEYAITTAGVIHALLNWIKLDRRAPRREILAIVRAAARPYLVRRSPGRTRTGLFAYSFFAADRDYDVYNVGAALGGAFQRLSRVVRSRALRRRLRAAADDNVRVLRRARRRSPRGTAYWTRTSITERPNALGHAEITASGILTYRRFGGRVRRGLGASRLLAHLTEFRTAGGWLTTPNFDTRRERATGTIGFPGLLRLALHERRLRRLAAPALREIRRNEVAPGTYATGLQVGPRTTVRGQAGVLVALAVLLWDRRGRLVV